MPFGGIEAGRFGVEHDLTHVALRSFERLRRARRSCGDLRRASPRALPPVSMTTCARRRFSASAHLAGRIASKLGLGHARPRQRPRALDRRRRADHDDDVDGLVAAGLEQQRDVDDGEPAAARRAPRRRTAPRLAATVGMDESLQARERRAVAEHAPREALAIDLAVDHARPGKASSIRRAPRAGDRSRARRRRRRTPDAPGAANIAADRRLAHRDRAGQSRDDHRSPRPPARRCRLDERRAESGVTSGRRPNQRSKAGAACAAACRARPTARARAPAPPRERRSQRHVDDVGDDRVGAAAARGRCRAAAGPPCRATLALTSRSASASTRGKSLPGRGASSADRNCPASASARARRSVDDDDPHSKPRDIRAVDDRPRRAARADHDGQSPSGRAHPGASVVEIGEKPRDIGVVAPQRAALAPERVDGAECLAPSAVSRSHAANAASLCGTVTFAPTSPSAPIDGGETRRTRQRRHRQALVARPRSRALRANSRGSAASANARPASRRRRRAGRPVVIARASLRPRSQASSFSSGKPEDGEVIAATRSNRCAPRPSS